MPGPPFLQRTGPSLFQQYTRKIFLGEDTWRGVKKIIYGDLSMNFTDQDW